MSIRMLMASLAMDACDVISTPTGPLNEHGSLKQLDKDQGSLPLFVCCESNLF